MVEGSGDGISRSLGHMLRTTASQNPNRDASGVNMHTMSELFLTNKPFLPDAENALDNVNALLDGVLGNLSGLMDPSFLNIVPRDIIARLTGGDTDTDRHFGQELGSGGGGGGSWGDEDGADESYYIGGPGAPIGEHVGVFGSPSSKTGGTSNLPSVTLRGYTLVREMGFDGSIGTWRQGDPSSDHSRGLAIDVMVGTTSEGREQGDFIANFFNANRVALNVDYVIWYERITSGSRDGTWKPYTRYSYAPNDDTLQHRDHPHISFRR